MSDEIRDALLEVKMLRELVGNLVHHLASGAAVDRHGVWFKDLKRVHRATRASNAALEQLGPVFRLRETWQVLADAMLETGGAELTEAACTIAAHMGIELRVSEDGGKTFRPMTVARGEPGQFWDHLCLQHNHDGYMAERIRLSAFEPRCTRCGLQPGHGRVTGEQLRARKGPGGDPPVTVPAAYDGDLDDLEAGDVTYVEGPRFCAFPLRQGERGRGCSRVVGEGGVYCDEHMVEVQSAARRQTVRRLEDRNLAREPGGAWWHWCQALVMNGANNQELGVLVMPGNIKRCTACSANRPRARDRSTGAWVEG